jgi:hypothetical protein
MAGKLARLEAQLPPRGPARVAVVAALALGGAVAVGLTALIAVFLVTALRGG